MPTLIVTGGSRGIGAACVRLAARRGWSVCINYRAHESAAAALVAEVMDMGGKAIAASADVAVEAQVLELFDCAEAAFGPVAGLVNNAGVLGPPSPLADIDVNRWNAIVATNLTGAFLCAREAVRRMAISRGGSGGSIVNVSSKAALLGAPHEFVDYAATKGGIDTLTVGLAREVAADGIRVNGVRPGLIETDIHTPDRLARLVPSVPMERAGTPLEVAQAILWLLSEEASYCTGVTIDVSGGR